jgi:hypothetical protein
MGRLIGACGVNCDVCPAYRATKADDPELLEQVLVRWRAEFDAPHITVKDILCDGCSGVTGRLCGYCQQCRIRPCALARGLPNCAHCAEFICDDLERLLAVCDRQEGFFAYARQARATLKEIRAGTSA